jgi:hypothetical protein
MKVLAVIITKDSVRPEALTALEDNRPDGILISQAEPVRLSDDRLKNKNLNCARNRNLARELALRHNADHFLFLDDDIVLPTGAIANLLSHQKPIIGGWFPILNSDRWVGGRWVADNTFYNFRRPERSVVRTDLVPLGCCLMNRAVLEQIEFEGGIDRECVEAGCGQRALLGECLAFSNRAADLGWPLYLDGAIICEHLAA